mgnify:FL=1
MVIVNRKIVRTHNYRLLNLDKFIDEESIKATDVIWKVCVDVANHRIFVITRPFQVYAWDFKPYYQLVMDMIWCWWRSINQRDSQSRSTNPNWYILDSLSSYQIVSFEDNLESVPFIDDLFWIKYRVKYYLLNNLFIECVESLIKESPNWRTTSTSRIPDERTESVYSGLVALYGNDMQIHWQTLQHVTFDDFDEIEYSNSPLTQPPTNLGRSPETLVGETSTNPF